MLSTVVAMSFKLGRNYFCTCSVNQSYLRNEMSVQNSLKTCLCDCSKHFCWTCLQNSFTYGSLTIAGFLPNYLFLIFQIWNFTLRMSLCYGSCCLYVLQNGGKATVVAKRLIQLVVVRA